jgi:isochorismate pyruvate lyase
MKVAYLLSAIISFLFSANVFASIGLENTKIIPATNCATLICVRSNIDIIDSEIVKLIGSRLAYVKRAGELKKGKQGIHDQVRENQIILKVAQLASKEGYPGFIAAEVYKTLLAQANIYEQQGK